MNKVYRLVWSKVKSAWVAVCEFAKSAGKSGTVGLSKTVIGIIVLSLLGLNGIALADPAVNELPTGGQITVGSGGIGQYGNSMLVRQDSQKMIVTWQSFDIGSNASVTFYQPSSSSIALNRVLGQDPSQILGRLNANGHVMLVNPAGIIFGDGSQVNVGGITASTLDIADEDFLAGHYNFINPGDAAAVENFGHILASGGVVALVAPVVKNQGSIDASNGSAALAAGDDITLDFSGDGLVAVTVNRSDLDRLVENKGAIRAGDGVVILTANSAQDLLSGVVNNSGIVEAEGITQHGGRILLDGGSVTNTGTLNAGSDSHDGGSIAIDGQTVMLGGDIGADGVNGGSINITSEGLLSLADKVHAKGRNGDGGSIHYRAERIMESTTGSTDTSGSENGGSISVDGGGKFASSGSYRADGAQGEGGYIDITADALYLLSADIDASGGDSGGLVRIGGAFQGGKMPDPTQPYYDSFLGRWDDTDSIRNADTSFVNDATSINVNGGNGRGGTAVVWSDMQTTFLGGIDAAGAAGGGSVELSSAGELRKVALSGVTLGDGQLLLDPKDIIIGDSALAEGWAYEAIMGAAYSSIYDGVEGGDEFGYAAVSLNGAGDRLAVGAYHDDGYGNSKSTAGAVYLFSFADTEFSGGALEAIIGYGYTGGKNISMALDTGNAFGRSVSLNAAGDRLAVGDHAAAEVSLFSFTDTRFSGGMHEATIGDGYTGGKNLSVNASNLGTAVSLNAAGDRLAASTGSAVYLFTFTDTSFSGAVLNSNFSEGSSSVSLNGAGDRLAVGDYQNNSVYLYSFTDTNFSGRSKDATIKHSGGSVAVANLETNDGFGFGVSLNAAGDRLAVGAYLDDGSGNSQGNSGAVYLFSFTDAEFSGGTLEAIVGHGYTGGKNVDVTLDNGDWFGGGLSLNAAGDRLAVAARSDDGSDNSQSNSGAVYLFSFTDTSFSGGTLENTVGAGYANDAGKNVSIDLGADDAFAMALSLNAAGDRLAVGTIYDDGNGDTAIDSGAVYLFSFTDTDFSGGALEATIGKGYIGGKNVDLMALDAGDAFGDGVSLNAAGDRLAVGASGDDGSGNGASDSGAIYLFSFSDADFIGGVLEATVGSGYNGGNNVDVTNLEASDAFGGSVSLNAVGDRLAVGTVYDDGNGNAVTDSGAVYLFSFSDVDFTGGVLGATVGRGYSGGNNIDVVALESTDVFGSDVSLNAAGDRLAVGAHGDDGNGNVAADSGAVYLFSFTDADLTGGELTATLGKGYSSGDNLDVSALEAGDYFGGAVSLNATGDRLAVGAYGDDGSSNQVTNAGAVHYFGFTDTSFSGGELAATIGATYSGDYDLDLTRLEAGDWFGGAVSLNAAGDRLAAGASGDDGNGSITADSGAVYLFVRTEVVQVVTPLVDAGSYASLIGQTANVLASDITAQLSTGASVTLQASNDITVSSAVIVDNASGDGGALSLNAGRSILVDADITTDNGALYLYANDTLANGVVDADRDAGAAVITLASGMSIDAGTGAVELLIRDGAGKTNTESGDITLDGAITADTIVLGNEGPTAGSSVVLDSNASLTAADMGTAIDIYGDSFTNNAGAAVLSAANGRWLVWSGDPAADIRGGLSYDFKQYNAVHGSSTVLGSGNGFLYELAPTLTAAVTGSISKVYDGTADASVVAGDLSVLSGVVDGDSVTFSAPTSASYDDKNVGTGKTVIATGVSLVSASNGASVVYGYQMASADASGITGDITAKSLTVSGITAEDKVYDGTTDATLQIGAAVFSGMIGGDDLTIDTGALVGSFSDKNAAAGKTVSISGITLTGADAGNYALTATIDSATADITPKALGLDLQGEGSKVYDGTTIITLSGITPGLTGVIGGDTVTLDTGAVTGFADKNVGNDKAVTFTGFALQGADAGNYSLTSGSAASTADITAKSLTVSGITAEDKVYDGTTDATLQIGAAVFSGMIGGDDLTIDTGALVGSFSDKNAAAGKTVSISGITLTGADAGNYVLTATIDSATADITAKSLTVSGITAEDKVYDGTTDATLQIGAAVFSGMIGGDDLTIDTGALVGSFSDKNAAAGKTVSISGITLTGADAGNYALTATIDSATADITAKSLTVSGITAEDKVYDGTTDATLQIGAAVFSGMIGGDDLTIDTGALVGSFSDKNAAAGKTVSISGITLTGADAGNYALTATIDSATADITAKSLTVSGITAEDKVYDGTTDATLQIGAAVFSGMIGGDDLTIDTGALVGSFSDKNAAAGKTVSISGITLTGADAGNYALTATIDSATADITPKALGLDLQGEGSKVYDGTTIITLSGITPGLTGVIGGDTVTLDTGAVTGFADKNVGNDKAVTFTGFALQGADAGNYSLTSGSAASTADITAKSLTVSGITAEDKVYDGTTDATLQIGAAVFSGMIGGDDLTIDTGALVGSFSDKNAAAGKTVSISGITLTGADAGNYVLTATIDSATADITAKSLTVSGITAEDKVYDGTTDATLQIGAAVFSGMIGGDDLTIDTGALVGSFSDKNAAAGKTVSISGITLTGADAGNYALTATIDSATADITAKSLTVSGITAEDKVYDGTTDATLQIGAAVFSGMIGGDDLTIDTGALVGSFSDKNAAAGKTVSISGITLTGADAGNYALTATIDSATADITAKSLTVSGITAEDKVYDGTTDATLQIGAAVFSGMIGGDDLTIDTGALVGSFSDKNAAAGKTVSISGITLTGADAGNYALTATIDSATADITPKALGLDLQGEGSKVYDGTTIITLSGITPGLTGVIGGDTVTLDTGAVTGFADKNVGNDKAVTFTGFALQGADAGNYSLTSGSAASTADITAKSLTVSGITAEDKVYDGTTDATLQIGAAVFSGMIGGDDLTIDTGALVGSFSDKNAAAGKTVSISGITLTGADAGNYVLTATIDSATADITAKSLTVSGITAEDKVYDGTTDATLQIGAAVFSGMIGGDDLTIDTGALVGSFSDKNAAAGKTVSISGITLTGADAGNYALTATIDSATADITAKSLTVSGITAEDKVYDGTTDATLQIGAAVFSGMIGGDDLTIDTGALVGSFSDKNAAAGKTVSISGITLTGADAGNYALTATIDSATADITAKSLTVSGITAEDKVYDGTTDATLQIGAAVFSGMIGGDDLTIDTGALVGSFSDKNAAAGKTVSISGITLTGADAGNYALTATIDSATADITAKALGLDLQGEGSKVYDGTTDINLSDVTLTLTGVIGGDTVTIGAGTVIGFADKNVGNDKAVTFTGFALQGADAGNYSLTSGSAASTADITAKSLTVSGITAEDKVYDGTTDATLQIGAAVFSGMIGGDDLTIDTGALVGSFNDKNAAAGKTVSVSGITLTGADAGNYALTATTDSATADITAKSLTVSGITADDKVYDGNTNATITSYGSLSGIVAGDSVALDTNNVSASFEDPNPGNKKAIIVKMDLMGLDSGNYVLPDQVTTADIYSAENPPAIPADGPVDPSGPADPFTPKPLFEGNTEVSGFDGYFTVDSGDGISDTPNSVSEYQTGGHLDFEGDERIESFSLGIEGDTAELSIGDGETYTVVEGDNLWDIAGLSSVYGEPQGWPRIYTVNGEQITNPDLIYPGQQLKIEHHGVKSFGITVPVFIQRGDTLESNGVLAVNAYRVEHQDNRWSASPTDIPDVSAPSIDMNGARFVTVPVDYAGRPGDQAACWDYQGCCAADRGVGRSKSGI